MVKADSIGQGDAGQGSAVFLAVRAALVSVAVAVVVVFLGLLVPGEPIVLGEYSGTGSSLTTGLMIAGGPVLALWGALLYARCSDTVTRRSLVVIVVLLVTWLLVVLIKYAVYSDVLISICWYLYYVPLIYLPMLCLFMAARASLLGRLRLLKVLQVVVFAINTGMVLLVLTNNMHFWVFSFDFADSRWLANYEYQWGYWMILVWEIIQYGAFFGLLMSVAHTQLRKAFTPVIMLSILALTYAAFYALRVDAFFRGNFTLMFIFFFSLALELCFDLGLLPSFAKYSEVFTKMPFDAKILSKSCEQVYATDCAKPLSTTEARKLQTLEVPRMGVTSFKLDDEPNLVYKLFGIHGGMTLLTEDRTLINQQQAALELRREQLHRENLLLEQDIMASKRLFQLERERKLSEDIEQSLRSAASTIRVLLNGLYSDAVRMPDNLEAAAAELAERRRCLMLVKLLVAYCKRKGGIVLDEKSNEDFDRERLQLVVNETMSDARSVGIDCSALVETEGSLPAAALNVLYDCMYDMVTMAFECEKPVLMLFFSDKTDSSVEMRAMLECDDNVDFGSAPATRGFYEALMNRDAVFSLSGSYGSLNLTVMVPRFRDVSREDERRLPKDEGVS